MYIIQKDRFNSFGKRLKYLRKNKKLKQSELGDIISSQLDNNKITAQTISSWETGKKIPHLSIISIVADILGVSIDFMLGRVNDMNELYSPPSDASNENTSSGISRSAITYEELPLFDGQPIYVVFKNHYYKDQWGILNCKEWKIKFYDAVLPVSNSLKSFCVFYVLTPDFKVSVKRGKAHPFTISELMASERVYIFMKSESDEVHSLYDGWYRHNETKTLLINSVGHTLPYEGLGLSYHAYSAPVTVE